MARAAPWVLAVILVGSFALKLPNLGHPSLKPLDESFHAIVAQNLMHHPWLPTLNDGPGIDVDFRQWQNARIFLHKPPLAMWEIAVSYAIFGVNTFALRLPSLVLSTLAVWLTYLIGRELIDEVAGLVAAALQGFNPVIAMIVHGYVFSDHVDISLLFWTELGIYLLLRAHRSGKRVDLILCGVAQGLAFLSKSYPALIVTALAILARVLFSGSREGPPPQPSPGVPGEGERFRVPLLWFFVGAVVAILPWNLYAFMRWPDQFVFENLHALRHVTEDVEQWGAPWDRLLFDYWISTFHVFYPAVIVGAVFVVLHAWSDGDRKLWFLAAWGFGVLVPHLLATSKTMTATLVGWPAMWLMLGYLVSQAIRGSATCAAAWSVAVVLPFILKPGDIPASGWGYPESPGFGVIMRQHLWVVWFVVVALAAAIVAETLRRRIIQQSLVAVAALAVLILGIWKYGPLAWRVTQIKSDQPAFEAIGQFGRALPPQAVFIVDERSKLENKLIQFQSRRTSYPLRDQPWQSWAQAIIEAGGLPYLITDQPMELPVVFAGDGRTVYACTPKAQGAAKAAAP